MELRHQESHIFFLRAIKKGTVVQLINSSPSGVPENKFRSVSHIYEDENTLCNIPDAFRAPSGIPGCKFKSLADVYEAEETLPSGWNNEASGVIGILYCPIRDGSIRGEPDCSEAVDDDGADDMTLWALRKKFRSKGGKRKTWDDGSDLMMPLTSFAFNIQRKKRKITLEQTTSPSKIEDTDVDEESFSDIYHLQRGESLPGKCKTEEESIEPSCSNDYKGGGYSSSYYTVTSIMDVDARTGAIPNEITRTSKDSTIFHEESAYCVIKKILVESEKQDYPEVACQSFQQMSLSHPPDSEFMQDDKITLQPDICSSAHSPSMDRTSDEHNNYGHDCFTSDMTSQAGADPVPDLMAINLETRMLHNPDDSCLDSQLVCVSPLLISQNNEQDDIIVTPVPDVCLGARSCSLDQTSDEHANNEHISLSHEMASPVMSSPVKRDHLPDLEAMKMEMGILTKMQLEISTSIFPDACSQDLPPSLDPKSDEHEKLEVQCVINQGNDKQPGVDTECEELWHREYFGMVMEQCGVTGASIEENMITSSLDNDTQLASSTSPSSYTHATSQADEEQPITSCGDADTSCPAMAEASDPIDEPFQLPKRNEVSNPYVAPDRLFSARKAISPNSQQKLCKAMEEIDSIDSREKLRSIGKLFSESNRRNRKHLIGKGDQINRSRQLSNPAVFIENTESKMKNNLKKRKMDLKITRLPSSHARAKNRCPSTHSFSERAISFSLEQMKDTEALAKKLTKELTCMRKIVAEKLNIGHTDDQVKTAISNASKAEATAKNWLFLMNRDCNRFQKVMEMNNKMAKTSQSECTAHKDRRKIKFADEVGADLCQIKFIENCCVMTDSKTTCKADNEPCPIEATENCMATSDIAILSTSVINGVSKPCPIKAIENVTVTADTVKLPVSIGSGNMF